MDDFHERNIKMGNEKECDCKETYPKPIQTLMSSIDFKLLRVVAMLVVSVLLWSAVAIKVVFVGLWMIPKCIIETTIGASKDAWNWKN